MNFVLKSDFDKGPYNLPASDLKKLDEWNRFMTDAEEQALRKYMGHAFYEELIANGLYLPEQKWVDIIDGASYIYSGILYKWVGLNKMLWPYLYFIRTQYILDTHTTTGIESSKVENANKKSPRQKMSQAWNAFADAYGACKNPRNTLYGFILTNSTLYENFIYKDPKKMNPYGL